MTNVSRYQPGEAWDLAMAALKRNDFAEAQRLCEHMVESDMKLMIRRISEKQREEAQRSTEPPRPAGHPVPASLAAHLDVGGSTNKEST